MTDKHPPTLEEGTVIDGKWEILSHIATGGKGEVYLARQTSLDRKVAVKIISSSFLESLEGDAEEIEAELNRFQREVKIMAKTRHLNVLQVFDYGVVHLEERDLHYIVMEYVPGPTLKLTMKKHGFRDDDESIRHWLRKYFIPMLHGVEAVHAQGIVHRDIKPANVLLDNDIPKITDFGLAAGGISDNITRSHHIIGTMPYMPEEQFIDLATTDVRADVYALGKILYEAVVGKLSKENSSPFKTVGLDNPQTPFLKDLDRIIRQATAFNRNERIPTVRSLREALLCLLDKRGTVSDSLNTPSETFGKSPTSWIFMTGLLVALLGIGLWYHFSGMGSSLPPDGRPVPDWITHPAQVVDVGVVPSSELIGPDDELAPSLTGHDGATLMLVQADQFIFYMEETQVTNLQFVDFLNSALNVRVEGDVVYGGDVLWIYLGEIAPGYETIRFHDGRFSLAPIAALMPVVRVTPMGAMAFAHHNERALPTMEQWIVASSSGEGIPVPDNKSIGGHQLYLPTPSLSQPSSLPTPEPLSRHLESDPTTPTGRVFSVFETVPNRFGIRGLGENVNEWVIKLLPGAEPKFHIHGGIGKDDAEAYLRRNPWEAFADVGFRTVLHVQREVQSELH